MIIPPKKATKFLRLFGLTKVPLIAYCWPRVIELSENRTEIAIPLNWRTRNHLNSMYFGVLAVGADCAGGLLAVSLIRQSKHQIPFVFKDLKAEFLKRAEGDVHFNVENGAAIVDLVRRAENGTERVSLEIPITATVPSKLGNEPVAKFVVTLSLKRRS